MIIDALEAIVLGLIQGLTEFLPVSSSGHLVITQALLGISEEVLVFDVFVHVGTLVAVFVVFWRRYYRFAKKTLLPFYTSDYYWVYSSCGYGHIT